MAVEDKYVDANIVAGKKTDALGSQSGVPLMILKATEEIAAADDNGSVYRFFKNFPDTAVIHKIEVANDAITDGTDYDFGVYTTDSGAVVDKDLLADGVDLSSANAIGSEASLLTAIDAADLKKPLFELAGKTSANRVGSYDLCLTGNTVGTAAGTVTIAVYFSHS